MLQGISFELSAGESMCILGPNGTGKTTLLRCLLGLGRPSAGTITWQGADLLNTSRRQRAKHLAYVPQSTALGFPYEVRDVVLMGRVSHLGMGSGPSSEDRRIVDRALERLQIGHLADRVFQQLSGGERQLVLLARAMAQQARILVLDEPTAALDYANQMRVLAIIRELVSEGFGVLMTSHSPDHAFWASGQVLMMREGATYRLGPTDDVITPSALSELYGTELTVLDTTTATQGRGAKICVPLLGRPITGRKS